MSGATLAVIHCQSDYKAEQGEVKLSNKAKREREKVMPCRSRLGCLPGQDGRQCRSYALAVLKGCCPGSGLKVCHLGHGGMERFISAGFGGMGASLRQAKAEQIKDANFL